MNPSVDLNWCRAEFPTGTGGTDYGVVKTQPTTPLWQSAEFERKVVLSLINDGVRYAISLVHPGRDREPAAGEIKAYIASSQIRSARIPGT